MEVQLRSSLEVVPLDVISEIGKHLDIKSITRFGSTKRNYRKYLIDNPQNADLYRTIYFYQYEPDKYINEESKVDWAQLCRTHCYNRLKAADGENVPKSGSTLDIDCIGNKVKYTSQSTYTSSGDYRAISAEFPLQPVYCGGSVGYYEITVTDTNANNDGYVNFGLTENGIVRHGQAIGWHADHMWFGYHGDDGKVFDSEGHSYSGNTYGPRWLRHQANVTVGCLINFKTKEMSFTVNGECHGAAQVDITSEVLIHRLHPIIATRENSVIEFNFGGKPFMFDLNEIDNDSSSSVIDEEKDVEPFKSVNSSDQLAESDNNCLVL